MPDADRDSLSTALLHSLGFTFFVRDAAGALRLHGAPPDWLRSIWPALDAPGSTLPIAEASPFLENFLIDAAECWRRGGAARAESGPWIEQDREGNEVSLEATALTLGGQPILLLERLGALFEKKKSMLQTARETVIAYQRLDSEMQKRDILLSCIADEMNAALANVVTSLRLIELEKNEPRTQQLLGLASRATEEQQKLINRVLDVFATELEGLYGRNGAQQASAAVAEVLRSAREETAQRFAEKDVRAAMDENLPAELRVAMDAAHLGRVVANLLLNALQNAPAGSAVQVRWKNESDAVLIDFADTAPSLPREISEFLFASDPSGVTPSDERQLRLQFCRVAVESCHGEIGYEPREGSNRYWIRIPKPTTSP